MNWKRVIALGLLGLTFGMGQSYAIDVNIPGADASISADKYQNYRVDTADNKILESKLLKKLQKIIKINLVMIYLIYQGIFIIQQN